jgi:hypothetical protein
MRIWDVPPAILCRQHLLGEHRELHAIWAVLTEGKSGYAQHPETRRWRSRLTALYARHDLLVAEMARRGYHHHSPLDPALASGCATQTEFVDPLPRQYTLLAAKGCACRISVTG